MDRKHWGTWISPWWTWWTTKGWIRSFTLLILRTERSKSSLSGELSLDFWFVLRTNKVIIGLMLLCTKWALTLKTIIQICRAFFYLDLCIFSMIFGSVTLCFHCSFFLREYVSKNYLQLNSIIYERRSRHTRNRIRHVLPLFCFWREEMKDLFLDSEAQIIWLLKCIYTI